MTLRPAFRTALRQPGRLLALFCLAAALLAPACTVPEGAPEPAQFSFQWMYIEGGIGSMGFSADDIVLEWDETHPVDQSASNSCASLPLRPNQPGLCSGGTAPGADCITGLTESCLGGGTCIGLARQCATVVADRLSLFDCDSSIAVTVQDTTANMDPEAIETLTVHARSGEEPLGEMVVLQETEPDSGVFQGFVAVSSVSNPAGVVFVDPVFGSLVVSYRDPDCDLDGPSDEEGDVGQLGENDYLDVDGDGIPNLGFDAQMGSRTDPDFDDDNCFDPRTLADVANPSQDDQDTFCVDAAGATDGTFCLSSAFCAGNAAAGFDVCRGDRVGDPCDNCPFDFNTDQADADDDGIGDACELDGGDLDDDGIANRADNCPSISNPGQQDNDSNGIGDACDGAEDADGDGVLDGADNCPVVANLAQRDSDADGIGDACESIVEDWDFDSVLNLQDNCPTVFNPADPLGIQKDRDGDGRGDPCDPDSDDDDGDGAPDDLLQFFVSIQCGVARNRAGAIEILGIEVLDDVMGDADGSLDAGETVALDVRLRNLALDSTGTPIALHDASVVLQLEDPSLGCLLNDTVFYGDFDAGEIKSIPVEDRFRLTLLRGPEVQTLDIRKLKDVALRATVIAREARLSRVSVLPVDVDILGDPTGGGLLGGTGELFEGFEDIVDPDGFPHVGADATSQLTQTFLGHRADDVILATDIIPVVAGTNCTNSPIGPSDCSVNTTVNDWHLHSFDEEPSNAPAGNQAHSGSKSLHMGRHLNPSNPLNNTYRFRQLTAFQSPPLNLGLTGVARAEWWQIVRMADDNAIGFITGQAGDYGVVQVRVDGDSDPAVDDFGSWERLEPVFNSYDHARDNNFTTSCKFDPLDDVFDASAGGVTDETMCFPQRGWSDQGEFTGTGAAPDPRGRCPDADSNGHSDCGSATHTGPGFTETGSVGTGVWVKTQVDLRPFLARRVQLRWVFSSIAFGNSPNVLSYNETPGSPGAFDINERDDGWLIDDILITQLVETELGVTLDGGDDVLAGTSVVCGPNGIAETNAEGDDVQVLAIGSVCAGPADVVVEAGPNGVNNSFFDQTCPLGTADFCHDAQVRVNVSPECWERNLPEACERPTLAVIAPGRSTMLDAAASWLDQCVDGTAHYEFVQCASAQSGAPCDPGTDGTLLQPFSAQDRIAVSPGETTRYRIRVRCSSQPLGSGCLDAAEARVLVYPSDAGGHIHLAAVCETAVTGGAQICDADDPFRLSFLKPAQGEETNGFSLYRAGAAGLGSPVVQDADCILSAFGGEAAQGDSISVVEPGTFLLLPGEIAFYLVGHNVPGTERPAGGGRLRGLPTARFVETDCP